MLKKNRYVFHYERGAEVAKALVRALDAEMTPLSDGSAADAFSKRWNDASAFIFVGALAIAVRSVAPLMRDKATDPALVVVSEDGEVVIPVVAGHVGGASDLARTCADILSAYGAVFTPTTSSDRSGFVAPDLWAARRGWQVLLRTGMASVIRKLIGTGKILVWVDPLLAESGTKFPLPCGYDAAATQTDADIIISPGSIQKLVGAKPQIVPRVIVAGVGCRRGAACEVLERSLKRALSSNPKGPLLMESLCELRTAEVKSDEEGLLSLAELCGVPLVTVSDEEIKSQAGDFSPSAAERHVGLPGVAEQAAASGGVLLGPRQAEDGVTVALSVSNPARYGELFVVGTGPGDARFFTAEARTAISVSDVVVGYGLYVDLLPPAWIHGKIVERYGMGEEEERVRNALDHAASGYSVALVSGGDPALFGLAPLVLSMAPKDLPIRVLPGITAAQAAGRAVGAPYSNGLVLLSISDYLQPWDAVVRAMECAEASGLTVAIYNPVKRGLAEKLAEVRSIFSRRRLLIVRDAGREDEAVREIPVEELEENSLDMRSLMLFLSPVAREVPRLGGKKIWLEARGYGAELSAEKPRKLTQFLVLGGTSEGKLAASSLIEAGYTVTVSVTRDAGAATVPSGAEALIGARDAGAWAKLLGDAELSSDLLGVIDATHPFASGATLDIMKACGAAGVPLCRFIRPDLIPEDAVVTDNPEDAARLAAEMTAEGDVIFLSIGVNMLPRIIPILREAGRGVLARMLPTAESMTRAGRAGLRPEEIIAVWGAGGADFNEALCADRGVRCVISKASGETGGVESKSEAARRLDIPLILISRPKEPEGAERITGPEKLLEWCVMRNEGR